VIEPCPYCLNAEALLDQPSRLDAQTAYELCAFLHWLVVALQRAHDVAHDPYWCFDDVLDAAERSDCHWHSEKTQAEVIPRFVVLG
jgi:hypothetical protein